jgi:thioredoxin-like negative regulator of GroEL
MKSEIARAGLGERFRLVEVDVDSDSRLAEEYGLSIPVLTVEGRPLFKGRLTAPELRRKLDRRVPDPRAPRER